MMTEAQDQYSTLMWTSTRPPPWKAEYEDFLKVPPRFQLNEVSPQKHPWFIRRICSFYNYTVAIIGSAAIFSPKAVPKEYPAV